VQAKLADETARPGKRERGRGQLIRRHGRLQRASRDATGSKEIPEVAAAVGTSGRFTSFLVADILGIGSYCPTSGDVDLVTSSNQHPQQHKSDDFRVERLIHSVDDNKNTSSMSTNVFSSSA